ncbi:DUF397 domain-containing protein [Saccharopolyspora tripterygii]
MLSDELPWKKSSRSSTYNNCVEVAFTGTDVLTRDSKNPGSEPLQFTEPTWQRFVESLRAGKLGSPHTS